MLLVDVFQRAAVMVCWTRLCAALQLPVTGECHTAHVDRRHQVPRYAPCFVDDTLETLREAVGPRGELTERRQAVFGMCWAWDNCSVLLQLSQDVSRLQVVKLAGVHSEAERGDGGVIRLTFDLPQSPLPGSKPLLLLAFGAPLAEGTINVTFSSQRLQPHTQSVCVTGETQFVILAGKASEGDIYQSWEISADTNSPDMKQSLKDFLIGENSGSNINVTPLLLFSGERGTDARHALASGRSTPSSHTSPFLCELKRFLADVMPRGRPRSPTLHLASLQSPPPLSLGLSSSETLLAGLINSSALTVFSFASCCSMGRAPRGELALPPGLLQELRLRLERAERQVMEAVKEEEEEEEEGAQTAAERLERLKELSGFSQEGAATGESQYRALLLLKVLQTVARSSPAQRGARAARADPGGPARGRLCGLRSLTVSLERHLVSPDTADIRNCHGSCTYPMNRTSNHAVLLESHIKSNAGVEERAPCCVPVAYDDLQVVDFREPGETFIGTVRDAVARECECR